MRCALSRTSPVCHAAAPSQLANQPGLCNVATTAGSDPNTRRRDERQRARRYYTCQAVTDLEGTYECQVCSSFTWRWMAGAVLLLQRWPPIRDGVVSRQGLRLSRLRRSRQSQPIQCRQRLLRRATCASCAMQLAPGHIVTAKMQNWPCSNVTSRPCKRIYIPGKRLGQHDSVSAPVPGESSAARSATVCACRSHSVNCRVAARVPMASTAASPPAAGPMRLVPPWLDPAPCHI